MSIRSNRVAQVAALLNRGTRIVVATAFVATLALAATPPASASGPKVVIVVGPSGWATQGYLANARAYAAQARAAGANVVTVLTPNATWARVKAAAKGASVFIYLGHGNGWPSPYAPWQGRTKNGLGLNPRSNAGRAAPVAYVGEDVIGPGLQLAPGAVVLLNHLCYASGNGEPGSPQPSWNVARERVDNYAAGFIAAGASAVLADGHSSLAPELEVLLHRGSIVRAWSNDQDANGHGRSLASRRSLGFTNLLDPEGRATNFYRALSVRTSSLPKALRPPATPNARPGPKPPVHAADKPTAQRLNARTTVPLIVRSSASSKAARRTTLRTGATVTITGALASDASGATWAPIRTVAGTKGWVAAWYLRFAGRAATTTSLVLRWKASTASRRILALPKAALVRVTGATHDAHNAVWFAVTTSSGRKGYMAGWLLRAP